MFYDKKIKYLDYCENGERISGGGFVKTEVKERDFRLYLNVRGLRLGGTIAAKVVLCGKEDESVLGQMTLENGQGEFRHECQIGGEGLQLSYEEITGIRVLLGENHELKCVWKNEAVAEGQRRAESGQKAASEQKTEKEKKEMPEKPKEEKTIEETTEKSKQKKSENLKAEKTNAENTLSAENGTEAQRVSAAEERLEEQLIATESRRKVEQPPAAKSRREVEVISAVKSRKEVEQSSAGEKQTSRIIPLLEDKWNQICAIYPHVKPFEDEREYLSIGPADFVMFTAASYRAANNSFLLHGYYNYKHLILTRVEQRGEIQYYLGVPGNYYAREKQVAVIFGFESFECAEEPAQDGDFGYYLMKVQL